MNSYDRFPYLFGTDPGGPYPACPFYPLLPWEDEKARDERRFRELYPALARKIQPLTGRACDMLEYDGSFMFDEYPDQLQIRRLSRQIYDQLDKSEYRDDLMMQEVDGRNWLEDFVTILLLDEMYRRRCRRRDRRCG